MRLPERFDLLGVPISALDLPTAVVAVERLATERNPEGSARYVCVRDVNGIVECQRDPELAAIHARAALVTPDGMPVVWWGRLSGHAVDRVYGPDLMTAVCDRSVAAGLRHFLYGGGPGLAEGLASELARRFPGIAIVGTYTPPFRPLTDEERAAVVERLNALRPDIVWVGLSSPKQERFMADLAPRLRSGVLIGVGAAFDFLAGTKRQAPRFVQRSGFEWLFRLATEPRRLWRRYLVGNSTFVWLAGRELLRRRFGGAAQRS